MAHDSWFSKEGDNWVANYDTVTYYVKGQVVIDGYGRTVNCVYTRIAGEPDSWAFIIEDPASQYMEFKKNVKINRGAKLLIKPSDINY